MSNCSNHKKEISGITDMKDLAEMIGELHYETMSIFLQYFAVKLQKDGLNDLMAGRDKLSYVLLEASAGIVQASIQIDEAWKISKPFMTNSNPESI
jgi:hypothetical protein